MDWITGNVRVCELLIKKTALSNLQISLSYKSQLWISTPSFPLKEQKHFLGFKLWIGQLNREGPTVKFKSDFTPQEPLPGRPDFVLDEALQILYK